VAGSGGSGESDAIPGTLTAAAQTAAQIQADSRYTVMVGGSAFPGTFSAIKGFPDNSSASKCAVYLSSGDIPYVSTLDAAIACSVDYYLWPEGTLPLSDLETFDAEGVSFLAVNQWCFWETKGPATGTITSDAWTTTLPPDWPQGPVVTTPYTTQVGYSIPGDVGGVYSVGESGRGPGVLTIVKYDVTGGFAEQASSP
jgi:hypothetical protein